MSPSEEKPKPEPKKLIAFMVTVISTVSLPVGLVLWKNMRERAEEKRALKHVIEYCRVHRDDPQCPQIPPKRERKPGEPLGVEDTFERGVRLREVKYFVRVTLLPEEPRRFRDHRTSYFLPPQLVPYNGVMSERRRTYRVWFDMVAKKAKGNYVEPFLEDFENFHAVMGDRPEHMSLRRKDLTKGWERGNLVWGPERKQKPRSCVIGDRILEYNSYKNAKIRCYHPSHERHWQYREIGCYMYKEWVESFDAFYSYMVKHFGRRQVNQSLDRIDPWGAYVPGNVRWATIPEQNRNNRKRCPRVKQLSFFLEPAAEPVDLQREDTAA